MRINSLPIRLCTFILAVMTSHALATDCETRLDSPAMALVKIVEMALERKEITLEQLKAALSNDTIKNPFASSLGVSNQFRRAFAAWEGELNEEQWRIFRQHAAALAEGKKIDAQTERVAHVATSVIFNPKVVDQSPHLPGESSLGELTISELDGRPIIFEYIKRNGVPHQSIFDPFSPDPSARLRLLPGINYAGSATLPATFSWEGNDYVLMAKEKKVFDLHTLADVGEKFGALRLESNMQTVVVNTADGPYAVSAHYVGSTEAHDRLWRVALAHPEREAEGLFAQTIGRERILWIRKFVLNGKEIVAVHLESKILLWDAHSWSRFPDIFYDRPSTAPQEPQFFIFHGRIACAHDVFDDNIHGIRITDVESGAELKRIPEIKLAPILISQYQGQQWLAVVGRHEFLFVNLETGERRELGGSDNNKLMALFQWESESYVVVAQTSPAALVAVNPFDLSANVRPVSAMINALQTFHYQGVAYALVRFRGQEAPSVVRLLNPP